jgi:hypothetical protein
MPRKSSAAKPALGSRKLATRKDTVDLRDRFYEPALLQLATKIDPPDDLVILDQQREDACTGFGLAAVINLLRARNGRGGQVSPRMLYEMARRYDDWPGEDYGGSSCRGAIKGWYHMGVCSDSVWPYDPDRPGALTVDRAREAFDCTIGAYYRLRPDVVDFHAALNEVGAIFASARVHRGWQRTRVRDGVISTEAGMPGGHAFAIVGYNAEGFWVQNSWGDRWGKNGLALWRYEDWKENLYDAWVFRLALPTPTIFPGRRSQEATSASAADARVASAPARSEIMGHYVHLDDGHFDASRPYWSDLHDVQQTARRVAAKAAKYPHVLFYAHGGLNSIKASARRVRALRDVFKANGIYPYHFMYETGLGEEICDLVRGRNQGAEARVGGVSDLTDWMIEKLTRRIGRALWREMKHGASAPFTRAGDDGSQVVKAFLGEMRKAGAGQKLHLAGHSTGAILQSHLLGALGRSGVKGVAETCTFLAPAASIQLFDTAVRPALQAGVLKALTILNLDTKREEDDHVAVAYRKSLLWLVTRAFEEKKGEPLLGLEAHRHHLDTSGLPVRIHLSKGPKTGDSFTEAKGHGDFDNDPTTMNTLLRTILKAKPVRLFTKEDLKY